MPDGDENQEQTPGENTGGETSGETEGGETTSGETTGGDTTGGETTGGETTGGETGGEAGGTQTEGETTSGTTDDDSGDDDNEQNIGDTTMTTTEITVLKPVMDNKQSYEIGVVASASKVALAAEMKILNAMACKNNSMTIFVDATTGGTFTIKAGDAYPNAVLGDAAITLTTGDYAVIQLEDISRFENRDGSINLTATNSLAGKIVVTGKRVGVDSVSGQNTRDYNAGRTLHYDPTYTG